MSKKADLDLDRRLSVLYASVDELRERLEACVQRQEKEFQVYTDSSTFDLKYIINCVLQTRRLDSYRREIRVLRKQRDSLSAAERESVRQVLGLWRALRDVRKEQSGYQNTAIKIVIRKVGYLLCY